MINNKYGVSLNVTFSVPVDGNVVSKTVRTNNVNIILFVNRF